MSVKGPVAVEESRSLLRHPLFIGVVSAIVGTAVGAVLTLILTGSPA